MLQIIDTGAARIRNKNSARTAHKDLLSSHVETSWCLTDCCKARRAVKDAAAAMATTFHATGWRAEQIAEQMKEDSLDPSIKEEVMKVSKALKLAPTQCSATTCRAKVLWTTDEYC